MRRGISLISISIIFLIVLTLPPKSFASTSVENIEWQLVFVTDNKACSNYDYQMRNTYHEITKAYMEAYQLGNTPLTPLCMNQYKFSEFNTTHTTDLLVVVYGKDVGQDYLNRYLIGGVYFHPGSDMSRNHVIIMCDCPNFQYSDPAWTLSHELSHFILNYRGYGPEIVEQRIHAIDLQYDTCVDSRKSEDCKDIKYRIWVPTQAYTYSVMPPYLEGLDDYKKSRTDSVEDLKKEITKIWSRGSINNSDYLILMGYDLRSSEIQESNGYFDQTKKFFTDGSKDTKLDIGNHNGEKRLSDNQMNVILSKIPKSMLQASPEKQVTQLPSWFKHTAYLWVSGEITDREYYDSLDYLTKKISREDIVTSNENSISDESPDNQK